MDIKSWWEKKKFKRAHIPTVEDALLNKPLGEKVFYDFSSIDIGKREWKSGWGYKPYAEGDPPFMAALPWAQDEANPDNVVQSDDELLIIQPRGVYEKYGVICSNFLFKYGTVRALMKLPKVKGAWSAFWIFRDLPEMDIFEHCGEWDNQFTSTYHWGCTYQEDKHMTLHNERLNEQLDLYNEYYLFEIEVMPGRVEWRINGLTHRVIKHDTPTHDGHIILNVTKGSYCEDMIPLRQKIARRDMSATTKDAVMHVKWLEVFNRCE